MGQVRRRLAPATKKAAGSSFVKSSFAQRAHSSALECSAESLVLEAFEEYGSYAGPPEQPAASEVGATSLILTWQPPQHLGGAGFEVLGYQIRVQYSGDGGFLVHTDDTAATVAQSTVEQLRPDTWHEFQVAAITSAGIGAPSRPSRPVLTECAPKLLRELNAAARQLKALRERVQQKRYELMQLARSGTMALCTDPSSQAGKGGGDATGGSALSATKTGDGSTSGSAHSNATLSAAEAKQNVHARRKLERAIETLERRVAEQELAFSSLEEQQELANRKRREQLQDAAADLREQTVGTGDEANRLVDGGSTTISLSDSPYSTVTRRAYGRDDPAGTDGTTAALGLALRPGAQTQPVANARRRGAANDPKRMQTLEAYTRLFLQDDLKVEVTYPAFNREATRSQMHQALLAHVYEDDVDVSHDKRRYFDLALNRVRSAQTHNVFPRFADWELEQLLVLFGRFDSDHDGVLEFSDFCRLMLLVGGRVNATYHEPQLLRMFEKVDLNGDHLIDLNEFLFMQCPEQPTADTPGVHTHPKMSAASNRGEDETQFDFGFSEAR